MSDIYEIDAILIQNAYTPNGSKELVNSEQLDGKTVSAADGLISYDFIDANNDNELSDTDEDGTQASHLNSSGDVLRYNGEDFSVTSILLGGIKIEYEDGSSYDTGTRGVRVFALENGDVIISPVDEVRNDPNLLPKSAWKSITLQMDNFNYVWTTVSKQDDPFPVCFTAGSLIETALGPRLIETLQPGDMIRTMDHGFQPLRWIGYRTMEEKELVEYPKCRPIRIRAGALGWELPVRDLVVSPQHRILLQARIVSRMFASKAVLVPAKNLLELSGVEVATDLSEVVYFHLMFNRHETILSEGTWTESLFLGPQAKLTLSDEQLEEIKQIFPGLLEQEVCMTPSHMFAKGNKVRTAVRRAIKNNCPLVAPINFDDPTVSQLYERAAVEIL